jgi:metal-responsive CopG/Arc/MetJ family transcriptional regulator
MAQKPLSQAGGESPYLVARFPREQAQRVIELSNETGVSRSEFIRAAVADAISRAEADQAGDGNS